MFTTQPRVQVPKTCVKGAIFSVKALVAHAMETGLRHDDQGNIIPRKIVKKFICLYAGVEVFSVDFHESVSANPYIEFDLEATESGLLDFTWEEDGGDSVHLQQFITVSG